MALDRLIQTSATPGTVSGNSFMDTVAEEITGLWDRSCIKLSAVAGTNTITATETPALTGALVDGMRFMLIPAVTNTGAATLNIDGSARAITRIDGTATQAGDLVAGNHVPLCWNAATSSFVIVLPTGATPGATLDYQVFTATGAGTWTKPSGLSSNAWVHVKMWGAGGGGSSGAQGGGGGGGAYVEHIFKASELGATEAVSVGTGGTVGATGGVGGSSTFDLLTAYGGGGGAQSATGGGGGGGGGATQAGASASGGTGGVGGNPIGGVAGAAPVNSGQSIVGGGGGGDGNSNQQGGDSWKGGGGGQGGDSGATTGAGGNSIYGGGGGGGFGTSGSAAGTSVFAGNGGATGVAGTAPAGGGGRNAVGGRGEIRVMVVG